MGFTPIDQQVDISQEQRIVFKHFVISYLLGVVDAAIQGSVDCVDYVSHWIVLSPFVNQRLREFEASRARSSILSTVHSIVVAHRINRQQRRTIFISIPGQGSARTFCAHIRGVIPNARVFTSGRRDLACAKL
jgi:hypothetical protein